MARYHRRHHRGRHAAGSSMGSHFAQTPDVRLQRSVFDRSHNHKTTFGVSSNIGTSSAPIWQDPPAQLIPVYVDEVLPGDTYHMRANAVVRLATPLVPIMDNIFLDLFAFYVPSRLLWTNWERFLGAQDNPEDSTDYLVPQLTLSESSDYSSQGSIFDYMGIPPRPKGSTISVNALPFRAYNYIWNYWFRDENLQDSMKFNIADGGDVYSDFKLLPRGARHDYFHSSLPWTQKGSPVTLPLGVSAPVSVYSNQEVALGNVEFHGNNLQNTAMYSANDQHGMVAFGPTNGQAGNADNLTASLQDTMVGGADLSGATAASINDIRQAFQIQHFLERQARGGTRIKEILQSHFGVVVPDARVQYPEFLGSGEIPINVFSVPQTSSVSGQPTPQGNLAAFSVSAGNSLSFSKSFVEHGYLLILAAPRADYTYSQGLNKLWSREGIYDFYWPEFSHLGEQAVLTKELNVTGDADHDSKAFGYQERYAEYRFNPNRASGLMRPQVPDNVSVWHQGQLFGSASGQIPDTLSAGFIQETPPIGRMLAVPSQPHFIADFFFQLKCVRPMPVYSVPGLMDHF